MDPILIKLKERGLLLALVMIFMAGLSNPGLAQLQKGDMGIGLQIGRPSGLSLKYLNPGSVSVDMLAAWDLGDFLFFNAHGLFEMPIGGGEGLRFFYGPGVFLGIHDRDKRRYFGNDLSIGISGTAGLSFWIHRMELYIRVTPRLALIEATDGDIGGGFGFRYFFYL